MIKELRDTINRAMPTTAVGLLRPRGLLVPLDPWMRGTTRFANVIGGQGSVWRPDIVAVTNRPSGGGESVLFIDDIWTDLVLESIVIIGNVKNRILDFDRTDPTTQTLSLQEDLDERIDTETNIRLFAFPVQLEGGAALGTKTIRVSSPLNLAVGDKVEIPSTSENTDFDNWKLTVPYDVVSVDFVEEDVEGKKYILTLGKPLTRQVLSDEVVYMRAYPAYFSGNLVLPIFGAVQLNIIGPFLVDFLSGPLVTDTKFEEFTSLRFKRADGSTLTPTVTSGNHNVQVNRLPIRRDQFLFWRLLKGKMNYDGDNIVCQLDADGEWRLTERLAPHMQVPGLFAGGGISPVAKDVLLNNETLSVSDGPLTATFEFQIDGTYVRTDGLSTIDVSSTTTALQVGTAISSAINASSQADVTLNLAGISNNDRLVVSDSVDTKTFEFKKDVFYIQSDASFTTVDLSVVFTDDDAATALAAALNSNLPGLSSLAVAATVRSINSGTAFSSPSLESPDNPTAISTEGFIRLGVTSIVVAGIVNLANKIQGTAGNVPITDTVSTPGFIVSGMSGGGGGIKWITKVTSDGDAKFMVKMHPNEDQTFLISAGITNLTIELGPDDDPSFLFDIRIASDLQSGTPATEVRFGSWELIGSRVRMLDADVVIRVETENYAASALYLKPLWPNLDLLRTQPDVHETNSHSLII